MQRSPKTHRLLPVFIGGTGRSGTTVLGDLLNEHSQVRTSDPTEIKFLANRGGFLDVVFGSMGSQLETREKLSLLHYRTYRQRRAKEIELRSIRLAEFETRLWDKWWQIDAPPPHGPGLHSGVSRESFEHLLGRYRTGIKREPIKQAREFLSGFIASQNNDKTERYWVETTPMNISYSHRLIKLFPEAKFIIIRRDPRDVISSLLTKNWGPNTPLEGVEWIEARLRADHLAIQSVPASQVLIMQLEDLVSNSPQKSYESILRFLSLQDEKSMKAFHTNKMTAENASSGRWRDEIDTPEFVAAIDEMNQRLNQDQII